MLSQIRGILDLASEKSFNLKKIKTSRVRMENNLELLYLDKYQIQMSNCPSAPNRMSAVFREQLVAFSLTFFAYAL